MYLIRFSHIFRVSTLAAFSLLSGLAHAQQTRTVVPGNPPLTGEIVDKTTHLLEWALDVRFTPAQQQELEQMLARDWKNSVDRRNTISMYELAIKVEAGSDEVRQRAHDKMQEELVKGLRQNANAPNNRWLLSLYDAAHAMPNAPTPIGPSHPSVMPVANRIGSNADGVDPRVLGKWRSINLRGIQMYDSVTRASAPTNGSTFTFQFNPDGTYEHTALIQSTYYSGCTMTISGSESGRYRINGNRVFLEPDKGVVNTGNPCAPSQNTRTSKTLGNRSQSFHFETNGGVETFVMEPTDANSKPDYYKREK